MRPSRTIRDGFCIFPNFPSMSLPEYAKWAQMIISGFSGLVLVMFWIHVRNLERKSRDRGFLYLGIGLLVWALLYMLELTFPLEGSGAASLAQSTDSGGVGNGIAPVPPLFDRFLRRILSVTNSCLFLLTLPFFDHGFQRLHRRLKSFHDPARWSRGVIVSSVLTLVLTLITYRIFNAPTQEWIAGLPDTLFSLIAILTLGYAMFVSFSRRKVPSLSGLTLLVLLGLLGVQVLDLAKSSGIASIEDTQEIFLLLRMCSHSLLAMLFFALAFTWVIERLRPEGEPRGKAGRQHPEGAFVAGHRDKVEPSNGSEQNPGLEEAPATSRRLVLGRSKIGKYYIRLTWPDKQADNLEILLSEGKFKYLLLAAVRKLNDQFVHGENDIRHLYGGNIDTSNSALKDALNKELPESGKIKDRGELMESKGQGKKQYRLSFATGEIQIQSAELAGDPTLKEILSELI